MGKQNILVIFEFENCIPYTSKLNIYIYIHIYIYKQYISFYFVLCDWQICRFAFRENINYKCLETDCT
jgi:hypothetical protein